MTDSTNTIYHPRPKADSSNNQLSLINNQWKGEPNSQLHQVSKASTKHKNRANFTQNFCKLFSTFPKKSKIMQKNTKEIAKKNALLHLFTRLRRLFFTFSQVFRSRLPLLSTVLCKTNPIQKLTLRRSRSPGAPGNPISPSTPLHPPRSTVHGSRDTGHESRPTPHGSRVTIYSKRTQFQNFKNHASRIMQNKPNCNLLIHPSTHSPIYSFMQNKPNLQPPSDKKRATRDEQM